MTSLSEGYPNDKRLFRLEARLLGLFHTLRIDHPFIEPLCERIIVHDQQHRAWSSLSAWNPIRQKFTLFPSMALSEWQVSKFSLHKLQAELQSIPSKINCETERSRNTLTTAYELLSNTLCCQENSQPPEALHLIQGRNICPAPRLISRIWPQVLLGFVASHVVLKIWRGYDLRESLIELIIGLFETSRKYLKNRVWLPLVQIYNTIRYDRHELALQSHGSLETDLASLKRMVEAFAQEALNYSESQVAQIVEQVDNGDITSVLLSYEQDLRHPIRSALIGNMIRSTLIQVQKSKVDLQLAVSAVDKLLQSNELNFHMLAIIPTTAVVWFLLSKLLSLVSRLWSQASISSSGEARHLAAELGRIVATTACFPTIATEGQIIFLCVAIAKKVATLNLLSFSQKESILRELELLIQTNNHSGSTTERLLTLQVRLAILDGIRSRLRV